MKLKVFKNQKQKTIFLPVGRSDVALNQIYPCSFKMYSLWAVWFSPRYTTSCFDQGLKRIIITTLGSYSFLPSTSTTLYMPIFALIGIWMWNPFFRSIQNLHLSSDEINSSPSPVICREKGFRVNNRKRILLPLKVVGIIRILAPRLTISVELSRKGVP